MVYLLRFSMSNSLFFFVKQKTAYEMRISDWSSDVCSSDLFTNPTGFARKLLQGVTAMSVLSQPHFHDEAKAFEYLESIVWADGAVCPHCGARKSTRLNSSH